MDPRYVEAVRRARTGDPRAFRQVAEHLGPELVRYLTYFLRGDVHAAHDVAQETLVQAWHALETISDPRHLRRWCYRVARCRAITWLRRLGPRGLRMESLDRVREDGTRPTHPAVTAPPHPRPEAPLERSLKRALRHLPPLYAGPVHLHYVQGYTTQETADLLGLRRTTVKMRLHRARAILREEIEDDQLRRGPPEPMPRRHRP